MWSIMIVTNMYINKQNRINLPTYTFNLGGNLGKKQDPSYRQDFSESTSSSLCFFFRVFRERPYFTKVKETTSEELVAGTCIPRNNEHRTKAARKKHQVTYRGRGYVLVCWSTAFLSEHTWTHVS